MPVWNPLRRIAVPLAASSLWLGCTSEPAKESGGPITVRIEPFTVEAGDEVTKCQVVSLGNDEAIDFQRVVSRMNPGSHHLILYRDASYLTGDPAPEEGFGECDMGLGRLFVYGAQEPERETSLPEGLAARIPEQTVFILEVHYANASNEAIEAAAEVQIFPVDPAEVEEYIGTIFAVDTDFEIPPGAGFDGVPAYSHTTSCPVPAGANVFRLGSHGHQRLDKFEIFHGDVVTGSNLSLVYESDDWHAPEEVELAEEDRLTFTGELGLRFTCTWHNETEQTLEFGESVDDEMCIMGAAYYPAIEGTLGLDGLIFCLDGDLYY